MSEAMHLIFCFVWSYWCFDTSWMFVSLYCNVRFFSLLLTAGERCGEAGSTSPWRLKRAAKKSSWYYLFVSLTCLSVCGRKADIIIPTLGTNDGNDFSALYLDRGITVALTTKNDVEHSFCFSRVALCL